MFSGGIELLFSLLLLSGGDARRRSGDARRRVVSADPEGGLQKIEPVRCVLYPVSYDSIWCTVWSYCTLLLFPIMSTAEQVSSSKRRRILIRGFSRGGGFLELPKLSVPIIRPHCPADISISVLMVQAGPALNGM